MMKNGEKTIGKGFELIELIGRSTNGLRGQEIAEKLAMPVSTAFRQLRFLVKQGYLANRDGVYTLGNAMMRLGNAARRQNPLSRIVHPLLAALSAATRETVHLAELRDQQIVYVDKVEGSRPMRMGSLIGNSCPLHCTGVGKAILAHLPEAERRQLLAGPPLTAYTRNTITDIPRLSEELLHIRQQGYAVDDCEHEPGVFCLAAPFFDPFAQVLGAVSVSGAELYLREAEKEFAELVCETAGAITKQLS